MDNEENKEGLTDVNEATKDTEPGVDTPADIAEKKSKITYNEDNIVKIVAGSGTSSGKEHRHHHHRHHHHHHHHSTTTKKNTKEKLSKRIKKFYRKKRKLKIAGTVAVFLLIIGLIFGIVDRFTDNRIQRQLAVKTENNLTIELNDITAPVQLVNPAVVDYMNSPISVTAKSVFSTYRNKDSRLDYGYPVTINFKIGGYTSDNPPVGSKIEISESADYSNPRIINLSGYTRTANVYLLKTGTNYYYRVTTTFSNEASVTAESTFSTTETPRILTIDGIANVRDIGGWKTMDGHHIRQGLLYRGSELDGAVDYTYYVSDYGRENLLDVLHIKTEMDLRRVEELPSGGELPLGKSVKHINYGVFMYAETFHNNTAIKNLFKDLAKKENYPVYLHCTHGLDRTGTVCYLLEALLGLDEQSIIREYELSALYFESCSRMDLNAFTTKLRTDYKGQTMQDHVRNYLLACGVTQTEINQIREILLEE